MQLFAETGSMSNADVVLSVVVPCLNEEETLPLVLAELRATLDQSRFCDEYEIIVADNGSTDKSKQIAIEGSARVVDVPVRGYGAALQHGIHEAKGEFIVMMDADFTYPANEIVTLVDRLQSSNAGMVVGSRIGGTIQKGAMPFLHRYLGTPALTFLVNRLWSANLSDVNSGMRAFTKRRFDSWKVTSPGMEFASELIVNCLENGDRIDEIPICFRKDLRSGRPHLNTWGDGMRHLLFLLSRAPHAFIKIGITCFLISVALACGSLLGPVGVGPFEVFGMHTLVFAIILGFLGVQIISHGLFLDVEQRRPTNISSFLMNIREAYLFGVLTGLLVITALTVSFLFWVWMKNGFHSLSFLRLSLVLAYLAVVFGSFAFSLLHLHVVKRVSSEIRRRGMIH